LDILLFWGVRLGFALEHLASIGLPLVVLELNFFILVVFRRLRLSLLFFEFGLLEVPLLLLLADRPCFGFGSCFRFGGLHFPLRLSRRIGGASVGLVHGLFPSGTSTLEQAVFALDRTSSFYGIFFWALFKRGALYLRLIFHLSSLGLLEFNR